MSQLPRALLGVLFASWAGFGCATTPSAASSQQSTAQVAAGETPEVPYAPKPVAAPVEQPKATPPPGQATAAPAAGGPSPAPVAAPAPAPVEPPKATQDPQVRDAFARALEASTKGDSMTAERELRRVVDRDSKLDYAWTNLGVVYERQALLDQAEKAYRRALEVKPDQDAAWDYLTRLYCRTGRSAQIEAQLRGKITEFPGSLGLRTALVVALVHTNKLEVAANEAKKVLKADERNVRAMQLLAQIYYREQKFELAKMVLENARAVGPNDASTHNALGLVNLALKQKPAALENFRQAATLKPDFAEARNNYGTMLNEAQDYESAVRELEGAVNAAPDFANARLNLGNAYRGKQDNAKAISQYKQVLKLRPDLADTYFNLAILHLDSDVPNMDAVERYKTALSYFDQYRGKGGKDDRVEQYVKDANKGIEKEERRREREKKDQLKRVEREAADKKKAEEDKVAADKKAETDKLAADKKAEADRIAAEKKSKAEAEAQAKKAAKAGKGGKGAPASKLGEEDAPAPAAAANTGTGGGTKLRDDDIPPPKPKTTGASGKVSGDEK